MRRSVIVWTVTATLFGVFVTLAVQLLPTQVLQSPLFGIGSMAMFVLLGFGVRWRFKLSSERPLLFGAPTERGALMPILGVVLVALAFLWIAICLLYMSPTVGNTLVPFSLSLIVGWTVLTWTSEAVPPIGRWSLAVCIGRGT